MAAAAEGGVGDSIKRRGYTNSVYFTFGRFNPPTIGHKAMIEKMIHKANAVKGEGGADVYVFVTSTQDKKKNPLSVYEKVEFLKLMFPDDEPVRIINTTVSDTKTIFKVIQALGKDGAGYKDIHLVVGSDRVPEFKKMLGEDSNVKVVSGGERDLDRNNVGIEAVSATKMRNAAVRGNKGTLRAGTNRTINGEPFLSLYERIRRGMGIMNGNAAATPSSKGRTKKAAANATGGRTRRGSSRR